MNMWSEMSISWMFSSFWKIKSIPMLGVLTQTIVG